MSTRICTDVGGTFSDVVLADENGNVKVFKSLTIPADRIQGIINSLKLAAADSGLPLERLMSECAFFSHGTTTATNALIEKKTAKVGLICTKGHRDILLFREAGKANPFDWGADYPEPYVPRYLTLSVNERIDAEGNVCIPLDEEGTRQAVRALKSFGVEVIAVAFLWSIANPSHEIRVAEIIEEEWPGIPYALSHVVNPSIREYRRTACTVIDASLRPLVSDYVARIEDSLRNIGYRNKLYLLTSSGGVASPQEIVERPLNIIDSGPSLAPVAGRFYAEVELGADSAITCDMGGTSFDVSRVTQGIINTTRDVQIGDEKLNVAKVDTKSIGAGGGSIAWVDSGGLLHVGPRGAGSEPGPACYDRGGTEATVTDANLLLGYLDAAYFLGGTMKLRKDLAEKAVLEHVAEPLRISVAQAAFAVWNTACVNMTEAIRDITVWEGIDPREYVYVSGGGAAGLHIVPIIAQLGGKSVVIPKTAAGLSAFGGLIANVVRESQRSCFTSTKDFDYSAVNLVLEQLTQEAEIFFENSEILPASRSVEFYAEARYPFQERELPVPVTKGRFDGAEDVHRLAMDFHDIHDHTLGSRDSSQYVECLLWRTRAIGLIPNLNMVEIGRGDVQPPSDAFKGTRPAHFSDLGGMVETSVFEGDSLRATNRIEGPAIIEEKTTTIVIPPGSAATVSRYGNYVVSLKGEAH